MTNQYQLPNSSYQYTIWVIDQLNELFRSTPSPGDFCRTVLGERDARKADKTLQRLANRTTAGRTGEIDDDLHQVLRWFCERGDAPTLHAQAEERFIAWLDTPEEGVIPLCEAVICFHLAMLGHRTQGTLPRLATVMFDHIEPGLNIKTRLLTGLTLHFVTDMHFDISDLIIENRHKYEASVYLYALALTSASCDSRNAQKAMAAFILELERKCAAAPLLGLFVLHVVLRLRCMPGAAAPVCAATLLSQLADRFEPKLQRVPCNDFISLASQFDYVRDSAAVVARRHESEVDLLALARGALRWIDPSRRRCSESNAGWQASDYEQITRRFRQWGLQHRLCGPVFEHLPTLSDPVRTLVRRMAIRGSSIPLLPQIKAHFESWLKEPGEV